MNISQAIFIVAAILSWTAFLWAVYRTKTTDETTLQTWGFIAFFAGMVTVQIEPIYTRISYIFGVNNLAWLLSYCLGAVATYLVINALYGGLKIKEEPTMLRRILYGTLLLLLLLFPSIAQRPNLLDHTNPTAAVEVLFMLVLYIYGACTCFSISRTFFKLQRQDTVLHSSLRWFVIVAAASFGVVYFIGRIIYLPIVFFRPALTSHPFIITFETIISAAFFACLGWVFFFLPAKVFQKLARPVEIADKFLALRELNAVQEQVAALCPPVVPVILNQSWRERVQNLDFHLYRAVIAILDGKKMLADHFTNAAGAAVLSEIPGIARRSTQLTWNDDQARRLHQTLSTVPDEVSYHDLVAAYRQVGRLYRKGVYS